MTINESTDGFGSIITGILASVTGPTGETGPTGDAGIPGDTGPTGSVGPSGQGFIIAAIYTSQAALLASTIPDGQFGLVATSPPGGPNDGELWLFLLPGGWVYQTDMSVQGIQGPTGDPGPTGAQGPTGTASWPSTNSVLLAGDGSAVTVGSGLSLSSATLVTSSGPTTVFEVDFSTLANQVFTNGQTYTIGGASWTVSNNNAGGTVFQAVNGTGITYSGTSYGTVQFYTTFGNLGITNPFQTIIFWVQCDYASATGNPTVGFYHRWEKAGAEGLGGNGLPTSNGVAGLSFDYNYGNPLVLVNQSPTAGGSGGTRYASLGSNNTLVSMLNPNLCVSQYYGQYSGGWPSTLQWMWTNHQPAYYSGGANLSFQYQPPQTQPTDPASRGFALVAAHGGNGLMTFRRMRVQVV